MNPPGVIVLHSSWRGVIGGVSGASALLMLGAVPISLGRGGFGAMVLAAIGSVLLSVMLWDYPVSSAFGPAGIERRALLRRHVLVWGHVDALARTRPGLRAALNWRAGGLASGGLVAVVGRRRYLLVDQAESRDEYAAVSAQVSARAQAIAAMPPAPPEGTPPTSLYRRRRRRGSVPGNGSPR